MTDPAKPASIQTARVPSRWAGLAAPALFLLSIGVVQLAGVTQGSAFAVCESRTMMQTLPIEQLQRTPLESLWYLHKQPPTLDAVRAGVAQFFPDENPGRLAWNVDVVCSWIWSAFLGVSVVLVYLWTSRFCPRPVALLFAALWMLHPAAILYTRYLESSLLSALLVLWFFYELWRLARGGGSVGRLALAAVLVFYTRTIFQWYFFVVLLAALVIMRVPRRSIAIFAAIVVVAIGPFLVRQYLLFGTTSTTTFAGYHQCSIIWYRPSAEEIDRAERSLRLAYPPDADLYNGGDPYNTRRQWAENLIYSKLFGERLAKDPAGSLTALCGSLQMNWAEYWKPSSTFCDPQRSVIGAALTRLYDSTFSGGVFIGLLLASAAIWTVAAIRRGGCDFRRVAGLLIPLGYVMLISNLCNRYYPNSVGDRPEWSEAQRMKFFLEPVFFVFLATQLVAGVRMLWPRTKH